MNGEKKVKKKVAIKTLLSVNYCSNTTVTRFTTIVFFSPQTAMNFISLSVDVSQGLEVPAKDITIKVQTVCLSVCLSVCLFSHILSCSCGEKLGEGLGSLLHHEPEMVLN